MLNVCVNISLITSLKTTASSHCRTGLVYVQFGGVRRYCRGKRERNLLWTQQFRMCTEKHTPSFGTRGGLEQRVLWASFRPCHRNVHLIRHVQWNGAKNFTNQARAHTIYMEIHRDTESICYGLLAV